MSCSAIKKTLFAVAAIGAVSSIIATSVLQSNLTKPLLITSLATAAIGAITCALSCCSTRGIQATEKFSDAENFSTIQLYNAMVLDGKQNFDHLPLRDQANAIRQWMNQHSDRLNSVHRLDLFNKNLTVIPREICLFHNLNILMLSDNRIESVQGLQNLPALQTLELSDNQIQSVQALQNLPALQTLKLSDNQIQSVQGLQNLPALQTLNLSGNQIQSVQALQNLPALQTLNLSGNQIQSVQALQNLPALQDLYLSGNQIQSVQGLQNLPALQTLYLSDNQIQSVQGLQNLPALQTLNLSGNQIQSVQGLQNLPALQTLDLSYNQIQSVQGLQNLPALQTLKLSRNQIQSVQGLQNLPALQTLKLSGNQIQSVQALQNLPALQDLYLSRNQIQSVQGLQNLPALQTLYLSDNQIQSVQGLQNLPALQTLNLSGNQIQSVQGLQNLPALQTLNLSRNQIRELSEPILNLSGHCYVDAENNRFSPEFVRRFQDQLLQRRESTHNELGPRVQMSIADFAGAPLASLEDQLRAWAEECNICIDLTPLLTLDGPNRDMLSRYLGRLHEIPDYRQGGLPKENILHRVGDMLPLSASNPEFRNQMIAIITEALSTCGDRVLLAFNDIEILCQCYRDNLTEDQVRQLAIGQGRYELIKKFAMQQALERGLGDEIETILACHIQLQKLLGLPISTQQMLYPACSGVTREMLDEMHARILSISEDALLAESPIWQNWQQKKHQERIEEITTHYMGLLGQTEALYNLKPEERANALTQNAELNSILRPLFADEHASNNYDKAAQLIARAREFAIANIK